MGREWVSGLRYWLTVPNNTSTSAELWGDLAAVLSWWEQRPSPISTFFVFCADYLKGGDFEGHICVHSGCCWGSVSPSQQQRSLGGLGTFLLTSSLSLTTLSTLPASLCPQTFWLWLFLWRKSNNTIWCPSPDSGPLNTSYSFVGCSPGCLPSMVERKSKMMHLAF